MLGKIPRTIEKNDKTYLQNNKGTCMLDLPREVLLLIFSKVWLPIKTICGCKVLCKAFNSLFSEPGFIQAHLKLLSCCILTDGHRLVWMENIGNDAIFTRKLNIDSLESEREDIVLINSSNNLVLLALGRKLCVVNPLTCECTTLPNQPKSIRTLGTRPVQGHGLGFSSKSNQYKVVKFRYIDNNQRQLGALVHTLGTDSWRDIIFDVVVPNEPLLGVSEFKGPVVMNGALHWLMYGANFILRFDLEKEEFDVVVPLLYSHFLIAIGLVNKTLYIGAQSHSPAHSRTIQILVLSNYGVWDSWKYLATLPINTDNRRSMQLMAIHNFEISTLVQNPVALLYYDAKRRSSKARWVPGVYGLMEGSAVRFDLNLEFINGNN